MRLVLWISVLGYIVMAAGYWQERTKDRQGVKSLFVMVSNVCTVGGL